MSVVIETSKKFAFTTENERAAKREIKKYPKGRQHSAIKTLLKLAQAQNGGWLSREVLEYVADYIDMPYIRALEVATFYNMFNLRPVGKHLIEVCTTTPCWLVGSDDILDAIADELGIRPGETTEDGEFTVREVECLGACVNAPMCMLHKKYYEDLTPEAMKKIIRALKDGKVPKAGPQTGERHKSAPKGGPTTLKDYVKA